MEPSGSLRCEACGAIENVARSEGLDVTLCGECFAERADRADSARVLPLLEAVRETLGRYVVLGEAEAIAAALFDAHTWAFDGAHATPYLLVLSPERRSGKTRLLEVQELLCARPWRVVGASEAAVFRKLAADRPTLLLDEVDALFGSMSERTEPLRAILNAGNRAGASVARCVGEKGDQVRDFPVFSPKVLAGIDTGRLPDTIRDRSIPIAMKRRTAAEPVARLRWRQASEEVAPLREALAEWATGVTEALEVAEPEMPDALDDRAAEAWEPLLAIADLAGGEWPQAARRAAVELSANGEDETSRGAALLGAIRAAFDGRDRMSTADVLEHVNAIEELPFGGWRDGRGLDPRGLAKLLRPYGVRSRTVWLGEDATTAKGYLVEQFTDAWSRWLPPLLEASEASGASGVQDQVSERPHEQADLTDLTDLTPNAGGDGALTDGEATDAPSEELRASNGQRPSALDARARRLAELGVAPWDDEGEA